MPLKTFLRTSIHKSEQAVLKGKSELKNKKIITETKKWMGYNSRMNAANTEFLSYKIV